MSSCPLRRVAMASTILPFREIDMAGRRSSGTGASDSLLRDDFILNKHLDFAVDKICERFAVGKPTTLSTTMGAVAAGNRALSNNDL